MILEVCVDSFKSLQIAKEAGADRIELCSALNLGGLTPSYGLMDQARQVEDLEIFIMIRPRSGDFLYDLDEFETMKRDIGLAKQMGFDGIVTGILKDDGRIDLDRMKELVDLAHPLKTVLHRAFDDALDVEKDIPDLIEMDVIRILTSGQRPSALEGAAYIGKLERLYGDRITIMPGAGINADNLIELYKLTGCRNYHMSGRRKIPSRMVYRDYVERMNTEEEDLVLHEAFYEDIRAVRDLLDSLDKE